MVDALGERATFNNILILMEQRLRKGGRRQLFSPLLVRDASVIAPVINIHSRDYRVPTFTRDLDHPPNFSFSPQGKSFLIVFEPRATSLDVSPTLVREGEKERNGTCIYFSC